MNLTVPFILASQSPRRQHLLTQLGLAFTVKASDVDEVVVPGLAPDAVVQSLALQKAATIAEHQPEALTLGADTIVVLDGEILGKPTDEDEARHMLRSLSGETHIVYTGIALIHPATNRTSTACEMTRVTFAEMSEPEIDSYVSTGSPMDKAGAYGIQDDRGALFISRIEGDYYNVVGLPLHRLYSELKRNFRDLLHIQD